jgi:hypothetical protein
MNSEGAVFWIATGVVLIIMAGYAYVRQQIGLPPL